MDLLNFSYESKIRNKVHINSQLFFEVVHPNILDEVGQIVHIISSAGQVLLPSTRIVAELQIFHVLYLALEEKKDMKDKY